MKAQNTDGSNKASSYIRAIDLLELILRENPPKGLQVSSLWNEASISRVQEIYEYVIEQQRLGTTGLFRNEMPASYWRKRFYSAALKSFKRFLIERGYEQQQWELYRRSGLRGEELSEKLLKTDILFGDELLSDGETVPSKRLGRDVVRQAKYRLDQSFFRKMILSQYRSQCCVTGLNIPEVLRARHIASRAEDERNRLNPANGLCLSATYDAAFDRYLVSFDEKYRMILSTGLRDYCTNEAFQRQFKKLEGQKILLPERFDPDKKLLEGHRARMVD